MTLYLHGVAGEQLENLRVDQWGTWRTWGGPVGAGGPEGGPEGGPVEDQDQGELTGLTRNLDSLQVLGALAVAQS